MNVAVSLSAAFVAPLGVCTAEPPSPRGFLPLPTLRVILDGLTYSFLTVTPGSKRTSPRPGGVRVVSESLGSSPGLYFPCQLQRFCECAWKDLNLRHPV